MTETEIAELVAQVAAQRRATKTRQVDALSEVTAALAAVEAAQARLATAVAAARDAGAPWTRIGAALGVSKQAAAARWRSLGHF